MKSILVIGSGYVGKAAAKLWEAEGHTITVTTRSKMRAVELSQLFERVEIIEPGQFKSCLKEQEVVLLSVAPDTPEEDAATYLGSAEALLRDLSESVQQIIYTSSSSVYGEHGGNLVDEESQLRPLTRRELILVETEKTLLKAPCKVCILRLGEITGPGRTISARLQALQDAQRILAGSGANICNLSPLEDILKALELAVKYEWQGIFNICSDLHLTRRELYEKIAQEHGLAAVSWDPTRATPHGGNKTVSSAKFRSLI